MNIADEIESVLATLYHPELKYIDLSLERIVALIDALGGIEHRLPPVVHVAGTNGKGSLLAYLKSIFESGGLRVHRYTSPHLVRFNERIVVAGKEIGDEALLYYLKKVQILARTYPVTFFEATTVAAFMAFADTPADVLLLETGLGGRLDATNILTHPVLTAITPVSFDHCRNLGETIPAIAGEKAGILKPGVPCVVGRQLPEAALVIGAKAKELSALLYRFGVEWGWNMQGGEAKYESSVRKLSFVPGLQGAHQYDNAAMAIACADQLPQFSISDKQIQNGLAEVVWPGRLQRLGGPYAKLLPRGMELWLDGGHNPQGGQVLADWLKTKKGEIYLVCGMVREKDTRSYLKHLAPCVRALYAIVIPGEETSQSAEEIAIIAREAGIEAHVAGSPENALQTIARRAKNPAMACICGSLYLAGRVLAENAEEEYGNAANY